MTVLFSFLPQGLFRHVRQKSCLNRSKNLPVFVLLVVCCFGGVGFVLVFTLMSVNSMTLLFSSNIVRHIMCTDNKLGCIHFLFIFTVVQYFCQKVRKHTLCDFFTFICDTMVCGWPEQTARDSLVRVENPRGSLSYLGQLLGKKLCI